MTENNTQSDEAFSRLTAELGDLREKLTELNNEQSKIRCLIVGKELERIKIQHKVYLGGIVKNNDGVLFEVSKIDIGWMSKPTVYGKKQKKDGFYSLVEQYIGQNWDFVA